MGAIAVAGNIRIRQLKLGFLLVFVQNLILASLSFSDYPQYAVCHYILNDLLCIVSLISICIACYLQRMDTFNALLDLSMETWVFYCLLLQGKVHSLHKRIH